MTTNKDFRASAEKAFEGYVISYKQYQLKDCFHSKTLDFKLVSFYLFFQTLQALTIYVLYMHSFALHYQHKFILMV